MVAGPGRGEPGPRAHAVAVGVVLAGRRDRHRRRLRARPRRRSPGRCSRSAGQLSQASPSVSASASVCVGFAAAGQLSRSAVLGSWNPRPAQTPSLSRSLRGSPAHGSQASPKPSPSAFSCDGFASEGQLSQASPTWSRSPSAWSELATVRAVVAGVAHARRGRRSPGTGSRRRGSCRRRRRAPSVSRVLLAPVRDRRAVVADVAQRSVSALAWFWLGIVGQLSQASPSVSVSRLAWVSVGDRGAVVAGVAERVGVRVGLRARWRRWGSCRDRRFSAT